MIVLLGLGVETVDVDQEMFALEVGASEIEEEGPEGEIPSGLILCVKCIDELGVILYL